MTLQSEVDAQRRVIRTDGYAMSIGELVSMYKERELELHPEFQRYFRWSTEQKSRLIESLLLGIPIPSFFVHQREDGVWDVVDGLQRLSAIFEVIGILRNEHDDVLAPLTMTGTRYLPSLEGRRWGANEADEEGLGGDLQRLLKRSKLDFKIVLRESDPETRLELFQRLNTGGTQLSPQELRNCLILMVSQSALDTLREMSQDDAFQSTVALSDRNIEEQYDVELVVRFLILRRHSTEGLGALGPLLDEEIIEIAAQDDYDWTRARAIFSRTFALLSRTLGSDAFRRHTDSNGGKYIGGFVVSLFEVFALGLGFELENRDVSEEEVAEAYRQFWKDENVLVQFRGRQAGDRLRTTLPMGRGLFAS